MKKRVAIYAYCPSKGEHEKVWEELAEMLIYCDRMEYELYDLYIDQEQNRLGNKLVDQSRIHKNALSTMQDRLVNDYTKGKIDILLVYSLKRCATSTTTVIFNRLLITHDQLGIDFKIMTHPMLDTTCNKEQAEQNLAFMREALLNDQTYYRSKMSSRQIEKKLGRPAIAIEVKEKLKVLLAEKRSKQQIADLLNIKLSTVKKYAQQLREQEQAGK